MNVEEREMIASFITVSLSFLTTAAFGTALTYLYIAGLSDALRVFVAIWLTAMLIISGSLLGYLILRMTTDFKVRD